MVLQLIFRADEAGKFTTTIIHVYTLSLIYKTDTTRTWTCYCGGSISFVFLRQVRWDYIILRVKHTTAINQIWNDCCPIIEDSQLQLTPEVDLGWCHNPSPTPSAPS